MFSIGGHLPANPALIGGKHIDVEAVEPKHDEVGNAPDRALPVNSGSGSEGESASSEEEDELEESAPMSLTSKRARVSREAEDEFAVPKPTTAMYSQPTATIQGRWWRLYSWDGADGRERLIIYMKMIKLTKPYVRVSEDGYSVDVGYFNVIWGRSLTNCVS